MQFRHPEFRARRRSLTLEMWSVRGGLVFCLMACLGVGSVGGTEPPVVDLRFSPDGNSLVAVSQAGIQVFQWPDLGRQARAQPVDANLHSLAFSPDGKSLAVGGGMPSESGGVEIYRWPLGKSIAQFDGHDDSVRSIAWVNATTLLTAGSDRQIKVWDVARKSSVRTLVGHSRTVDAICLLADGKTVVSAGADQSLRVWNLSTGKLTRTLHQHTKPVQALAAKPAAAGLPMVASAAADRTIRFWQPTIGRMVRYVRLESEPLDIVWVGKGERLLAACADGQVRYVDPVDVKVTHIQPAMDGWAYAIAVHPSQSAIVVGGTHGQIRRLELR